MNDHDINPSWFPVDGMPFILRDNIDAVAIKTLHDKEPVPMPVPPSEMAVHPVEFLDDDGRHDFDLITSCPANFPDLWEEERLAWATDVCLNARTSNLRRYDPARLVRDLLREDS